MVRWPRDYLYCLPSHWVPEISLLTSYMVKAPSTPSRGTPSCHGIFASQLTNLRPVIVAENMLGCAMYEMVREE